MKYNELRTGIYVNFRNYDTLFSMSDFMDICLDKLDITEIKPILITEKWLLNFGFEKQAGDFSDYYEHKVNYNIGFTIPKIKEYHRNGFQHCGNLYPHIKFVHQLQDIFHALTGKELELSQVEYA